ncbi:ABC transporter ATP-binding protein/permease, partial [Rhizobiaceae sp. 2RAB30]
MTAETNGKPAAPAPVAATDGGSLGAQLGLMLRAFVTSPLRNVILIMAATSFLVIVATAGGQVLLNRWNQPFYDAIERR